MLEEICKDLVIDEDKLTIELLTDAGMNARICDDEELYFAYIKVLEEYVYASGAAELRRRMVEYWKETEDHRRGYE